MDFDLSLVPNLILGGVSIAVGVLIVVQGLKVAGVVSDDDQAKKAGIVVGAIFGAVALAGQLFPVAAPYIELAFKYLVGGIGAGLIYAYGLKPAVAALAENLSTKDLNG